MIAPRANDAIYYLYNSRAAGGIRVAPFVKPAPDNDAKNLSDHCSQKSGEAENDRAHNKWQDREISDDPVQTRRAVNGAGYKCQPIFIFRDQVKDAGSDEKRR